MDLDWERQRQCRSVGHSRNNESRRLAGTELPMIFRRGDVAGLTDDPGTNAVCRRMALFQGRSRGQGCLMIGSNGTMYSRFGLRRRLSLLPLRNFKTTSRRNPSCRVSGHITANGSALRAERRGSDVQIPD